MGWKMDSHGNWTQTSGGGDKKPSKGNTNNNKTNNSSSNTTKTTTDKGNTSDTDNSIKISTANREDELKYAEECNFGIDGDYLVRRGAKLKVRKGVADRWKGKWLIVATTHTIDSRGYKTEGTAVRIPYREEKKKSGSKSKGSSSGGKSSKGQSNSSQANNSKKNNTSGKKTGTTGSKWIMDSSGVWRKK